MDFVTKEIESVFNVLVNNDRLIKALDDNLLILRRQNYIGEYEEAAFNEKMKEIETINNENIYNLATTLYKNKEEISSKNIALLVNNSFLRKEIKDIFDGVFVENETLKEIYYCFKHCQINSFFQNNRKFFLPEYDLKKIEENEQLDVFLDAILKEFDKLNYALSSTSKAADIEKVDEKYLSYLTQLLGFERKDASSLNEESFRELSRNIIDVYKIKGTNFSFELFFNFLGFNVEIKEFFFDRRYFYSKGTNNKYTNEKSKASYRYYMTTENPTLNKTEEFSISETVLFNNIGTQYSLLEFDSLSEEFGERAVLGYSKLDKNNKLYTGKVYTYFKTNYIYYNVVLDNGDFPNEKELESIKQYLDFLSPNFILKTIEARSANKELDNIFWNGEDFYFNDMSSYKNEDGAIEKNVRQSISYIFLNKDMGQNRGKKLIFSRMFNYIEQIGDGKTSRYVIEVGPTPTNKDIIFKTIKNDWYVPNDNSADLTEMREFVINNKKLFGTKIKEITTKTLYDYLNDNGTLIQKFDGSDEERLNILKHTKIFKQCFRDFYTISPIKDDNGFETVSSLSLALLVVKDSSKIFNTKEELKNNLNNNEDFRAKLRKDLLVAVKNEEDYVIKRYQTDKDDLIKVFIYHSDSLNGSGASIRFDTLEEAKTYVTLNNTSIGTYFYIKEENKIYLYDIRNTPSEYFNLKTFNNIIDARAYYTEHWEEIVLNGEFYLTDDLRLYNFIYQNRKVGDKVWFNYEEDKKLYEFVDSVSDECFIEVSLKGDIVEYDGTNYIVHDGFYPYYNEDEDRDNFIFYNHIHNKIRPTREAVKNFYIKSVVIWNDIINKIIYDDIYEYANMFYGSLNNQEKFEIDTAIDSYSAAVDEFLPSYLGKVINKIYTDSAAAINGALGLLNGYAAVETKIEYTKLIELLTMFVDIDENKTALIVDFFAELEFKRKLTEWRERYFTDNSDLYVLTKGSVSEMLLGSLRASLFFSYGKIGSSIGGMAPESFTCYSSQMNKQIKPKVLFYDFVTASNSITFYLKEEEIKDIIDINLLIDSFASGRPLSFINAVFNSSVIYNYKPSLYTSSVGIKSIARETILGEKFVKVLTNKILDKTLINKPSFLSPTSQGFILFNNFKNTLKNNKLVYPRGFDYLRQDVLGNNIEYNSFGYDKDLSLTIENGLDFTAEELTQGSVLESNGELIINTTSLNTNNVRDIEIEYLPSKIEFVFDCTDSEVKEDSLFDFIFDGKRSYNYSPKDVLIDCGGA